MRMLVYTAQNQLLPLHFAQQVHQGVFVYSLTQYLEHRIFAVALNKEAMDADTEALGLMGRMQQCGRKNLTLTDDFVKYLVNFAIQNPATSDLSASSRTCSSLYALNISKRVMIDVFRFSRSEYFKGRIFDLVENCKQGPVIADMTIFDYLSEYGPNLSKFRPELYINFFAIVCFTCMELQKAGLHSCVPLCQTLAMRIIVEYSPGLGESEYRELDTCSRNFLEN